MSIHDVTKKIFIHESGYIVNLSDNNVIRTHSHLLVRKRTLNHEL